MVALCGLGIALAFWFYQKRGGSARGDALEHRESATRVLGQYLASHYSGQRALVISNPFTREKGRQSEIYKFEEAGIRGLKEGLGQRVKMEVDFPALREEALRDPRSVRMDPRTTTPLSYLVAEDAFARLIEQHADCEIVVSLIGLPANFGAQEVWKKAPPPRFALLLPDWRMVGNQQAIGRAFAAGKVVAAVINKPGAPDEIAATIGNSQEEFDRYFLFATPENVDRLLENYPQAF